jgi:hypothetical protein
MPPCVKLGTSLVANYPQIGGIIGSVLLTKPLYVKLAALLVANYPQMPPFVKLVALLVAHYCMLSANSAITDINKTSMLLLTITLLWKFNLGSHRFPWCRAHLNTTQST